MKKYCEQNVILMPIQMYSNPKKSTLESKPHCLLRHGADDIRITRVSDAEARHAEVFTTRCAQLDVVAGVVMHTSLGKHGVVFDLRLAKSWAVVGDDHKFGYKNKTCRD